MAATNPSNQPSDFPETIQLDSLFNYSKDDLGDTIYSIHKDMEWDDIIAPTRLHSARIAESAAANLAFISGALNTLFFLFVHDNKIKVMYGLKPCIPDNGNGSKYAGLVGGGSKEGNLTRNPHLYSPANTVADQQHPFGRFTVRAKTFQELEADFANDDTLLLAEQADPTNPEVTAFKALPVSPLIALLFISEVPVNKSIDIGRRLYATTPDDLRHHLEELLCFLRVAATQSTDDINQSAASDTWLKRDPSDNTELETWYYQLINQFAPKKIAPTEPPTNGSNNTTPHTDAAMDKSSSDKKSYRQEELQILFKACGSPEPHTERTFDDLPLFWRSFVNVRGNIKGCRLFVENHLRTNKPQGRRRYTTLFSTEFLTSLKDLSFDGNDKVPCMATATKGLSIFNLAPTVFTPNEEANKRDQFDGFEQSSKNDATENLALKDLNKYHPPPPTNATEAITWIDSADIILTTIFGENHPLHPFLTQIIHSLEDPAKTNWYTSNHWVAFIWEAHSAIRSFFSSNCTRRIHVAVTTLMDNKPFHTESVPPALLKDKSKNGRTPNDPQYSTPEPGKRRRNNPGGNKARFSSAFESQLQRARAAVTNKELNAKMLAKGGTNIREMLGPDFIRLISDGKAPCFRYFIGIGCNRGQSCNNSHQNINPPRAIVDGITNRLSKAVDKIVANPENF